MKALLIAEKPSVMRAIEDVYRQSPGKYDKIEFAAFHGHLMALKEPEELNPDWGGKWEASKLPMLPEKFEYKASDPESVKKLMSKIQAGNYDYLINACDAGREGEHIFWSFYEANGLKLDVKRYWASSNTKPAITKALAGLLPASKFEGMKKAAFLRAAFDWEVGMNFSRAASISCKKTSAIGRVMSPVLKLVVDRENEIRSFKAENFYEVKAKIAKGSSEFSATCLIPPDLKKTRFSKRDDAEKILKALNSQAVVKDVKAEEKTIKAPTLFSLAELQKTANKAFKLSPDKTLEITQTLYEKGFVTYPRTESRYLPTDMIPELMDHIKTTYTVPGYGKIARKITESDIKRVTGNKDYVDNGKIEDHHAIIPTEDPFPWESSSEDERMVYTLIIRQFLSIFLPPYKAETTSVLLDIGGNTFKAEGTTVLDKGYTVLYKNRKEETELPKLAVGEILDVKSSDVTEGKTKAPERYSPNTLLSAMQNAGNFVDDKAQRKILKESAGLGTAATRAEILKKLVEKGYLRLEKNQYTPSEFSMEFIKIFGDKEFCSPAFTAVYEEKLRGLEEGKNGNLQKEINEYVKRETDVILKMGADLSNYKYLVVGKCPICGQPVYDKTNYYVCANYKSPCEFIVSKSILGAAITNDDMTKMLNGGRSSEKKLTKKDGTTFTAKLAYDKEQKKIVLANNNNSQGESLGKCPCCGEPVVEGKDYYLCSKKGNGCDFVIKKEICEAKITKTDVKKLLNGKTIKKNFTWKSGKKSEAGLQIKDGKTSFCFE